MTRRLPPLNSLRGFEAVARHTHVRKASIELGITHSAVSHQIRTLEDALDTKLFKRVGRRLRLSEAGQFLLPTVQQALDTMAEACARVRRPQLAGRLTLAMAPGFTAKWFIPKLGRFTYLYPQIDLSVDVLEHDVRRVPEDADLCVLWGDGHWERCWVRLLGQLQIFPVCSPQLLRTRPIRAPDDLRRHKLIHADDGVQFARWLQAHDVSDFPSGRGLRFSSAPLAIEAALFGHGVALADNLLTEDHIERGTLVRLFDNGLPALHQYYVVCEHDRLRSPMVRVFLEWLFNETANFRA
jgi:LysR family transcriptional regulator, glycine cleavage system transcriptional activator